jgi:hypothetical protein
MLLLINYLVWITEESITSCLVIKERRKGIKRFLNGKNEIHFSELHILPLIHVNFCFVQDDTENSTLKQLYVKLMAPDRENFPLTTISALQRVCSIKYAFMGFPESVMPLLKYVNCSIVPLPYKTYPISLAMAFSPRSPYTDFWSYRWVSTYKLGLMLSKYLIGCYIMSEKNVLENLAILEDNSWICKSKVTPDHRIVLKKCGSLYTKLVWKGSILFVMTDLVMTLSPPA